MENDALNCDFQKKLRWITIAIIVLTASTQLLLIPVVSLFISVRSIAISEGFLIALALWSWNTDYSNCSLLKKFFVLLMEVIIVAVASYFGVHKIYQFLYMCVIAKSALNLQLKPLCAITLITFGLHAVCSSVKVAEYYSAVANVSGGVLPPKFPLIITTETQLYFLFAMAIVAAMTRTMVSERKSRLRAEQLADNVEHLIIKNERSRISRDIHDALGHTLTSLNIQLDVAKTMFDKDESVARQALNVAKELASGSLAEVRRSVHMIREEQSSPFNLSAAVSGLAERAQKNHKIKILLSPHTPELPLFKAHNLFCIIQEALTNAQRHAHANSIQIKLENEPDFLHIQIADDGTGFDSHQDFHGFGLRSMNERAEGVGGTLQIESSI